MSGFRKFLLRGNVVDLAVAVVIGAAFGAVVTAFTQRLHHAAASAVDRRRKPATSARLQLHREQGHAFPYGDFINALIAFVIIAAVVYFFWSSCR